MGKFYVYALSYPDGTVFYVGKGSDKTQRLRKHEFNARRGHKCHRCSVIRKIWREGGAVGFEKIFQTDNEDVALSEEVRLIAHYRSIGVCLTNETNGGDGKSGYIASAATRLKHRLAMLGNKHSLGKLLSEEHKAAISAALRDKPKSEEARKRMSDAQKGNKHCLGRKWTPEFHAKFIAKRKNHPVSNSTRAKISASLAGHIPWNKGLKTGKGLKQSPETIKKRTETRRKNHPNWFD